MRRVESCAALAPLLSAQLRRGVVTNCFLSPADYQREIDAGLFYEEGDGFLLLLRQRAVDNQCFTVGTSPARDESASYVAWGNSMICDPWGTVLHCCGAGEEVAVTELDMTRIDAVRRQLPILSARRTDVYELQRV